MNDQFRDEFRFYYSRFHVALLAGAAGLLIGAMLTAPSAESLNRDCQVMSHE